MVIRYYCTDCLVGPLSGRDLGYHLTTHDQGRTVKVYWKHEQRSR